MTNTTQTLLIVLPIILVSMTLHEMMHAFTSHFLGDDTAYLQGRVSFNPLRHIDPFLTIALPLLLALSGGPIFGAAKPVQVNFHRVRYGEFGAAIVGIVGPLTNLLLAIVAAALFHSIHSDSILVYRILADTVAINIGFFVFNSIPWPPLDGSRLLYAFAPRSVQQFMETIESWGIMGLVFFMLVFYSFIGPLVGRIVQNLTNGLIS